MSTVTKPDIKMPPSVNKRVVHELIAVAIGLVIAFLPPPDKLTVQSMWVMGLLLWAILNWMLKPIPDYVAMILMASAWVILGIVPFPVAFGQLGNSTVWLVIGVLSIGAAVSKSGLLTRITLMAMRLFPPTFKGQIMAMLGAGTMVAPLIPSTAAKISIAGPVAQSIGSMLGFPKRSKGFNGMTVAMYTGFCLTAPIFLNASFFAYIIQAALPPEVAAEFTWGRWLAASLPWGLVMMALTYFVITRMYKPESETAMTKEVITGKIAGMGPMSKEEWISLAVLVLCIVFWILEAKVGISATLTALVGMALLTSFEVVTPTDFLSKTPWTIIVFMGGLMGLPPVLAATGVNAWVAKILGPIMSGLTGNPYLFIFAVSVAIFIARFAVDMVTSLTLFTTLLGPFCIAAGISPWIGGFIVYAMNPVWVLQYQNPSFLLGYMSSGGEEFIDYQQAAKYALPYAAIVTVAFLASVPYWQMIGLIR